MEAAALPPWTVARDREEVARANALLIVVVAEELVGAKTESDLWLLSFGEKWKLREASTLPFCESGICLGLWVGFGVCHVRALPAGIISYLSLRVSKKKKLVTFWL